MVVKDIDIYIKNYTTLKRDFKIRITVSYLASELVCENEDKTDKAELLEYYSRKVEGYKFTTFPFI